LGSDLQETIGGGLGNLQGDVIENEMVAAGAGVEADLGEEI
jgi:hypothetical protein